MRKQKLTVKKRDFKPRRVGALTARMIDKLNPVPPSGLNWAERVGICKCGHIGGNNTQTQHAPGADKGHGPCEVKTCSCRQFAWVREGVAQ